MYFSPENLPGVNPVVINYKIRIGQQGIVLRSQTAFSVFICGGRKTEEYGVDIRGYMQG